jgi:hypothetical protein
MGEKLSQEPALQDFHLETEPPEILPNEHWKFRILGKL